MIKVYIYHECLGIFYWYYNCVQYLEIILKSGNWTRNQTSFIWATRGLTSIWFMKHLINLEVNNWKFTICIIKHVHKYYISIKIYYYVINKLFMLVKMKKICNIYYIKYINMYVCIYSKIILHKAINTK